MKKSILGGMAALGLIIMTLGQAAGGEQWLSYRSQSDPAQAGITTRTAALDAVKSAEETPKPPAGAGEVVFFKWAAPAAKDGVVWMAVGDGGAKLYVDGNCDGKLSDDTAINRQNNAQGGGGFPLVRILFPGEDGPVAYHVNINYYGGSGFTKLVVAPAGWYQGDVEIDGQKMRCVLLDYNANGTFNDVSDNPQECDRIGVSPTGGPVRPLGKYVQAEGALYLANAASDGAWVDFEKAGEMPLGAVKVKDGMTSISFNGQLGYVTYAPEDGMVMMPAGKWRVDAWAMERRDKSNLKWIMNATSPRKPEAFELNEGGEVAVDSGEPVIATVTAGSGGGTYVFQESLKGRSGESISLALESGTLPPPRLRIKNADGTYDELMTFKYG